MTQIPMHSLPNLTLSSLYQAQYNRLLAYQQAIEAELARRNLHEMPIEKLFRLSDLLTRQLQRLLKAAPPVSNQIKADQGSPAFVEAGILPAGESGFQPPAPAQLASNQIKVIQASAPSSTASPSTSPVGTDSNSSPSLSATSPSSQIKADQGSSALVEAAILAAGDGGILPPVPSDAASNQIKADQDSRELAAAGAPSSEFKVQGSTFKVQGSEPLEHCLRCAEPLPALLPNGRRPDRYCKCGNPIVAPPGTSRLECCPHCGEVQRPHGYNAFRHDNRCRKCWRDLPPLDPKSPTPWLPPARPAPAPTKG